MSANITMIEGSPSIVYNVENGIPWHTMGTAVKGALTIEDAVAKSGANFEVEKKPAFAEIGEENGIPIYKRIPEGFATVRMDQEWPMAYVGSKYAVIQNAKAFDFFDPLVADGSLKLDTAGCLGLKGERMWILAEVADPMVIVRGDEVSQYIALLNSHDGSCALRIINTPIRIVCQNTQNMALAGAGKDQTMSIRHTTNYDKRLEEARTTIERSLQYFESFGEAARQLAKVKMTEREVDKFIISLFPYKKEVIDKVEHEIYSTRARNDMSAIKGIFEHERVQSVRGSAWSLYNAVTEWADHYRLPVSTEAQKHNRLKSIVMGSNVQIKEKAAKTLLTA